MSRIPHALAISLVVLSAACASQTNLSEVPMTAGTWSMDAVLVESCCCDAPCPCVMGLSPTHGHCHGNRLVEIVTGHEGEVRLDGVKLVVTFDIGNWTKLYFSDEASEEQVAAATDLLKRVGGFVYGDLVLVERVPLEVERDAARVAFSVPAATTEVEVVAGRDGAPIRIENLRSFDEYVQHRSIAVAHTPADVDQAFEHSGTNGFTARFRASSADA